MKVEQIKTPADVERYIEGCLNDFETAISTKDETVVFLAELVVHIYKEAKKETEKQLAISCVSNRKELLIKFCDALFEQKGIQITNVQIDFLIKKFNIITDLDV